MIPHMVRYGDVFVLGIYIDDRDCLGVIAYVLEIPF